MELNVTVVWPTGIGRYPVDLTSLSESRAIELTERVARQLHSDPIYAVEGFWCANCNFRSLCEARLAVGILPPGIDQERFVG